MFREVIFANIKRLQITKVNNLKIKVEMEDDENVFEEVFAEGLLDLEVRFNID